MSIALISAAWRIDGMAPTEKLVLLALCDWANDEGESLHPSIRAIAVKSSLSQRQAQRVVHSLIDGGWVNVVANVSGGAPGSTRQYRLNVKKITQTGDTGVTGDKLPRVTPATETGDMGDVRRVTPVTQTGDTGVTLTVKEPLKNRHRTVNRPDGVPEQVWDDFLIVRKAKNAPLTPTALAAIEREAAKAGLTLAEALSECCERTWQTFRATWFNEQTRVRAGPPPKPSRYASVIADLTGKSRQPEDYIDVEPTELRRIG